ncbi:MAG: thioredoxin family protein [Bacteroidales bacterium]|nr:thioredoxin family protein [Bacteroidales bacterium]
MKRFITIICAAFLLGNVALFASSQQDEVTVIWSSSTVVKDNTVELIIKGACQNGWHTYSLNDPYSATTITVTELKGLKADGAPYAITVPKENSDGNIIYEGDFKIGQKFLITDSCWSVDGYVTWIGCTDQRCSSPDDWEFSEKGVKPAEKVDKSNDNKNVTIINNNVSSGENKIVTEEETTPENFTTIEDPEEEETPSEQDNKTLWALILEAVIWGFAMILTPCVFPMIPMTVSYFLKSSDSPAGGRFKALMYGLFIILLYTVPISIIIGLTWIIGGEAVTADIFNWLSTHWVPNLIFFVVFLVFAASFFGAFEITLPSKLVNKSDAKSDKKGLAGIFFMALTLVLVSFSCTGPIVGSVLIKSTQGEFWTPMITMLAFSTAFALGFTFFAIFPTLLKNGPWMNSVKVVFGFIELAFGLKFLSVADQTYHWHLLDREIYLALWIVIFSLLGLYLLGKIRFKYDDKVEHIGLVRLGLSIASFAFVVYMIPGMWGAPLKGISGFLPPMETQDFVLGKSLPAASSQQAVNSKYDLKMPLGLSGYFTLEEGLEAAKKQGKPVFVDITGHGCVNCREMEQRVWSDERVLGMLANDFVIVALYTDDKSSLEESDWITTDNGKVLKDLGRKNSYIVRSRFGVNAQPNYTILDTDGKQLVPVRGYNLNIESYISFLQSGLDAFKRGK